MLIKRSVERAIAPRRSTNWTGGIKCSPANKNGWRENGKRKKPGALARAFHHSGRATCRNAYAAAGQTGCASRICVTRARTNDTRVALNPRYSFAIIIVVVVKDTVVAIAAAPRTTILVSADGRLRGSKRGRAETSDWVFPR